MICATDTFRFSRAFAMPSRWTFSMAPVASLLARVLDGSEVIVDPFSGQSEWGTHRNDLALTGGGVDAREYLDGLVASGLRADAVLIDPPYSPRQVAECYRSVGITPGQKDTQTARLYREVKDRADRLLVPGGIAVCFGWNSCGMGKTRGYAMQEILLVQHGGAHNDTIVTVESKRRTASHA